MGLPPVDGDLDAVLEHIADRESYNRVCAATWGVLAKGYSALPKQPLLYAPSPASPIVFTDYRRMK